MFKFAALFALAVGLSPEVNAPTISGWLKKGDFTFNVDVHPGLDLDAGPIVEEVRGILADQRGWASKDTISFTFFPSTKADIQIRIVTPWMADRMCNPLIVESFYSCRNGAYLIINSDRWKWAVEHWDRSLHEYRAYVVNHEMGHFLGQYHQSCHAKDAMAHIMVQQTVAIGICKGNGWPYPLNYAP